MTAAIAAAGWSVALFAMACLAFLRASVGRRLALVAQAAHELRGPLAAALLGLHGVAADAAAARRLAGVELELRRAGLALRDLDAAPSGRRAPEYAEVVDVRTLLAEAVEGWRPLARSLATELQLEPGGARLLVWADRLRLAQALGNLVLNALEHGAGPVRVRAHATRTAVRIEVRDHGPGLPGTVTALTAGAAHAARRGHGLAVAARVAARYGGRVLTAPVDAGACVALELPRLDRAAASGTRVLGGSRRRRTRA